MADALLLGEIDGYSKAYSVYNKRELLGKDSFVKNFQRL